MSTETTNKKIKIDNGTTFGRTYTDKAVDELLKNVGGGGISVIELTDKNGTIASAQLGKINANPQNFAFKYSGKILLFTKADSTTYQYCNNTTSSSDNNVMTTSTLLTIESSTGVYTIAENVHNVVANSIHPVNGGDLTNIQVGSKVYSIPSGGGTGNVKIFQPTINVKNINYNDDSYSIEIIFNNNIFNEIKEYVNSLISANKSFSIQLFVKSEKYTKYQFIANGSGTFYDLAELPFTISLLYDNAPGLLQYLSLGVSFNNESNLWITTHANLYSDFKSLASMVFTNNTVIKVTVISYD